MLWLERAERTERAERIRTQQHNDKNKLYALHAPEVECIGKGKARMPCEFGVKSAVVVSHEHGLLLGAGTLPRQYVRRPHPERGAQRRYRSCCRTIRSSSSRSWSTWGSAA